MDCLTPLLILVHLRSVALIIEHQTSPDSCDFNSTILPLQTHSFANENWPDTYDIDLKCRWTFNCLEGYACRLRCDVGLPATVGCYMDRLLVSTSRNPMLGARVFCGKGAINLRSLGTRITMKLISSKYSPGGRFQCTVSTEKWKQSGYSATVVPFEVKLRRMQQAKGKV